MSFNLLGSLLSVFYSYSFDVFSFVFIGYMYYDVLRVGGVTRPFTVDLDVTYDKEWMVYPF